MARQKTSGMPTASQQHTVKEKQQYVKENENKKTNYELANDAFVQLRDISRISNRTISTIDKEKLKVYFNSIGANEKNLRNTARYFYYRSNILFRLVNFYADMWDLRCRKVVPQYDLAGDNNEEKTIKSYNDTLDVLDRMNLHGNLTEALINVYIQDIFYGVVFYDETGMFIYPLEPDECVIDGRYATSDFSFAVDMSKWSNQQRQAIIGYLGYPFTEMWQEYQNTGEKYVHVPDDVALCLKFRTDMWDLIVPPFVSLFLQLASLEDLVDIQAEADALSIYKLIYLPMKVHNNSNSTDDFMISPDISAKYFKRLVDDAIPDDVGAAMVAGDELKTIDFSKTVDSDTNSVEQASNQILQTAGGGAVLNANSITSTAAFNAWLKSETEFAMSTLLPQINGFTNRFISYRVDNPCKVEHFEVSIYTKDDLRKSLLESNQYSYSNRLAYNTLLGISEKDTLATMWLENSILKLQEKMVFPLKSSYTQSGDSEVGEVGEGRPASDDSELSPSGDRMRNQ